MKYWIDCNIFKPYDRVIIYNKGGLWKIYSYTDEYKLTKADRSRLIDEICRVKKVLPDAVKFVKCVQLTVEDE